MQSNQASDNPAPPLQELSEDRKAAIRNELDRILGSVPFRTSKRSQQCLRFIVEKTLEGQLDHLKERSIGTEVFGRALDYDTNSDAVVRISANDLRKRLAQYHESVGHDRPVRISLPAGSYHSEFYWPVAGTPEAATIPVATPQGVELSVASPEQRFGLTWKWTSLAGAGVLLMVLLGTWLVLRRPKTAVELFWAPVLQSPKPVLISPGHPVVYILSHRLHDQYDVDNPPEKETGPHIVSLGSVPVPASDIVPVTDQFVGSGDSVTMARLTELFGRLGKPVLIRFSDDASFEDLRNSPTVLIGAFSNHWNMELGKELRFTFEWRDHAKMIADRVSPGRVWRTELDASGHTRLDYALVSRIHDSTTGQFIVQAAGVAQYGTQAAGEFLTDPRYWDTVLREAPADWQHKNVQIVIRAKILGNAPGSPEVVAIHCW